MSDLPERIWACMGGPMVGMFVSGGNNGGWPEYVRADIVQALTAERNKAVLGNHRFNEHEPTWAELTSDWKARAEAAEAERDRLRDALNQSRLAFAGLVSVQSAIDLLDSAALDPNRLRDGVQP